MSETRKPPATPAPSVEAKREDAAAATSVPPVATPSSPAQQQTIKYMHPANRKMVWSGEGEQPEWVTAYLASGGSWTALANAAEKLLSWPR